MPKFLLTVCVFGLLLSSASAEEKSPEQLLEERSGIEGLESQTLTRVVFASGAKHRIGFYVDLNPDCSAVGDINVRVTKQPEHGTVETVAATDYVRFPKENIRSKCNLQKLRARWSITRRRRNIPAKMSLTCSFSTPGICSETSFRHKRALNKPTTFAPLSPEMLYGAFFVGR